MKKIFSIFVFVLLCQNMANAQDVIITKDGDALKVWNTEVSSTAVFYREKNAENAPIQRMEKKDILMIKYQDGRKVILDGDSDATTAENNKTASSKKGMDSELVKLNKERIAAFNSTNISYIGNTPGKNWGEMAVVLGLQDNSIIENEDVSLSFSMTKYVAEHSVGKGILKREKMVEVGEEVKPPFDTSIYKIVITIKNKTNKTLYVDLANSFVITCGEAQAYYVPTAKSESVGTAGGVGVNLGAVAGAAGISGPLGTLANGVSVGSGRTHQNVTTTFSQRVIAVPPMSSKSLDPQDIGEGSQYGGFRDEPMFMSKIIQSIIPQLIKGGYAEKVSHYSKMKDFHCGETIDLMPDSNATPLSAFITYGYDELLSETTPLRMDFYVRKIVGFYDNTKKIDYSECPLIFFYEKTTHLKSKYKTLD